MLTCHCTNGIGQPMAAVESVTGVPADPLTSNACETITGAWLNSTTPLITVPAISAFFVYRCSPFRSSVVPAGTTSAFV